MLKCPNPNCRKIKKIEPELTVDKISYLFFGPDQDLDYDYSYILSKEDTNEWGIHEGDSLIGICERCGYKLGDPIPTKSRALKNVEKEDFYKKISAVFFILSIINLWFFWNISIIAGLFFSLGFVYLAFLCRH